MSPTSDPLPRGEWAGFATPSFHSPGWPNNGRFIVVEKGKICSSCLNSAIRKREVLDKTATIRNDLER